MPRSDWTVLTDEQLLGQCSTDTYRASGPGGQKRNKTSSAVRLRHRPTGLIVIAEESRSQHENRAKAVRRMRQAIYLQVRDSLPFAALTAGGTLEAVPVEITSALTPAGRLDVGRKDARFWPAAGAALDVFDAHGGRLAETAMALGITTANLVSFLQIESKVWQRVYALRKRHGHGPLH